MSAAILISMLPQDFKDMVFESQGASEIKYELIRDEVLAVAGSRINASHPSPMDVGEIKPGKSKEEEATEWQEDFKTQGEDIDAIKGGGKGGQGSQCFRCGGYEHLAKFCATPAPIKGEPKGYGKGKGDDGKGGKGLEKKMEGCALIAAHQDI